MSKEILSSEYLYGVNLADVKGEPYYLVLFTKIRFAKALLEKLVKDDNMQDKERIKKVYSAIGFNTSLLVELGYSLYEIALVVSNRELPTETSDEQTVEPLAKPVAKPVGNPSCKRKEIEIE
jgi:hypothetical protein